MGFQWPLGFSLVRELLQRISIYYYWALSFQNGYRSSTGFDSPSPSSPPAQEIRMNPNARKS